jgi:hypothetical protein
VRLHLRRLRSPYVPPQATKRGLSFLTNIIAKGMDEKIHVSRNRDSLGVFTE